MNRSQKLIYLIEEIDSNKTHDITLSELIKFVGGEEEIKKNAKYYPTAEKFLYSGLSMLFNEYRFYDSVNPPAADQITHYCKTLFPLEPPAEIMLRLDKDKFQEVIEMDRDTDFEKACLTIKVFLRTNGLDGHDNIQFLRDIWNYPYDVAPPIEPPIEHSS